MTADSALALFIPGVLSLAVAVALFRNARGAWLLSHRSALVGIAATFGAQGSLFLFDAAVHSSPSWVAWVRRGLWVSLCFFMLWGNVTGKRSTRALKAQVDVYREVVIATIGSGEVLEEEARS